MKMIGFEIDPLYHIVNLKTLFKIVEAPFNFFFNFDVCVIMLFRWTNKQLGIKKF